MISSAFLRSVRSRVTFEKPHSVPSLSRNDEMMTLAQNCFPSFLKRQPSSSNLPSLTAIFSSCSGTPRWMASVGYKLEKCLPMISSA